MGVVKSEIVDDNAALAEWVGRKLRNHDPMYKRVLNKMKAMASPVYVKGGTVMTTTEANKLNPNAVFAAKGSTVETDAHDPTKILYTTADGKTFEFSVKDVTTKEVSTETHSMAAGETLEDAKQAVLA